MQSQFLLEQESTNSSHGYSDRMKIIKHPTMVIGRGRIVCFTIYLDSKLQDMMLHVNRSLVKRPQFKQTIKDLREIADTLEGYDNMLDIEDPK